MYINIFWLIPAAVGGFFLGLVWAYAALNTDAVYDSIEVRGQTDE
jgi:uncharacterized membrane protein YesL